MEPFVQQNPKGLCEEDSSLCPPRAVTVQGFGCVPGWEGRALLPDCIASASFYGIQTFLPCLLWEWG